MIRPYEEKYAIINLGNKVSHTVVQLFGKNEGFRPFPVSRGMDKTITARGQ